MSKTILIIEDEQSTVDILERVLKDCGYIIETAKDGKTGLKKARNLKPDLILTDIMMPHMDGLTLCLILKEDPATKEIPVIMLTSQNYMSDIEKGFEAKTDAYLTKPIQFNRLLDKVKNLIG